MRIHSAPAADLQASVQARSIWLGARDLNLALSAKQNVTHPSQSVRFGESQNSSSASGREFGQDCFSIASFASFSLITLNTIINVITNINSNNNDDNNNNSNNNNNNNNMNVNMNTGRRKRSTCTPMSNAEVAFIFPCKWSIYKTSSLFFINDSSSMNR